MVKSPTPVSERKQSEAFCLSLGMRRSRSAWFVVGGNAQVGEEVQDFIAALA